jgi:hypothetical protein
MMEQKSFGLLCKNNPRTFSRDLHSLVSKSTSKIANEGQRRGHRANPPSTQAQQGGG